MILCDVNIYLVAKRSELGGHGIVRPWLESACSGEIFAYSDLALMGFIRIATHPKIFPMPLPFEEAVDFVESLRALPNAIALRPGEKHFQIFLEFCRKAKATGNLVTDAYFAALAVEHGCTFITLDKDFTRFPGLKWFNPLQA